MFDLNTIDSQGIRMTDINNQQPTREVRNALEVRNLNFFYGAFQGLKNINLNLLTYEKSINIISIIPVKIVILILI